MNHALPIIVNASGSMAELDPEAVWLMPHKFSNTELIEAMETLWRNPVRRQTLGERARAIVLDQHTPEKCAKRYAVAIERFHQSAATALPALLKAIVAQEAFSPDDASLVRLSEAISTTLPLPRPAKRLYVDISIISRNDIRTGIQRVTRALTLALLESPPTGYRVEPVYLSDAGGVWHYRHARTYTLDLVGCPANVLVDESVDPQCGDILLLLDLAGSMLTHAADSGLFMSYRGRGVLCIATVYDLLPVLMPEVFPPGANEDHYKWLEKVCELDGAVCISRTVANELKVWHEHTGFTRENRRPFTIGWFHLGADVSNSAPSQGLPHDAEYILRQFKARPSFLMVGTIEPRKGYMQVIEAFTQLWEEGVDINLIIVGGEGWKGWVPDELRRNIPETAARLRSHPELNKRLFWLESISDEYLEKVYAASTCLIAASYGEGFGLPLIEAAQHKLPIIARDIPVFREVAGECALYFDAKLPPELAEIILEWLSLYRRNEYPRSENISGLTWMESAKQLLHFVKQSAT
jgi:glycosyltransferase involved in cell wall biosynthesis